MKRLAAIALTVAILLPALAHARKTTYIATNHRFNYVKLKEVKPKVAIERTMTQPVMLDEEGIREALKSVKLSRSFVIKKEVDDQVVFNDASIDFLAPNLAKAFAQASDREEVVFAYLMKNPFFILRNDRLNLGTMWVSGNELHINFQKLYAKVTGDTDKRGNEGKAIANSRGLRINLELMPGQQMSIEDPREIVLDMHYNYAEIPDAVKPLQATTKTMAGETVPIPGVGTAADVQAADAGAVASNSTPATKGTAATTTTTGAAATTNGSGTVKTRLSTIEQLKKDGVITNQEYKEKRKEILKDL